MTHVDIILTDVDTLCCIFHDVGYWRLYACQNKYLACGIRMTACFCCMLTKFTLHIYRVKIFHQVHAKTCTTWRWSINNFFLILFYPTLVMNCLLYMYFQHFIGIFIAILAELVIIVKEHIIWDHWRFYEIGNWCSLNIFVIMKYVRTSMIFLYKKFSSLTRQWLSSEECTIQNNCHVKINFLDFIKKKGQPVPFK